jgi:CubicO group peptidase (beta-lactamase class C family)
MDNKDRVLATIEDLLPQYPNMHGEVAVAQGDQIVWHQVFSHGDAPWSAPKNSQYLIASITKQFTAVALLKALYNHHQKSFSKENALQKVKADLQRTISAFCEEGHDLFDGQVPGWAKKVTPHHLLTHTSGVRKKDEATFEDVFDVEPGISYAYSNPGYCFIGKFVSAYTKQPLETFLKEALFDPAGMTQTLLPTSGTPEDLQKTPPCKNLVLGVSYDILEEKTAVTPLGSAIDMAPLGAAGAIISTTADLIHWNDALYQGRIIPLELVHLFAKGFAEKESCSFYEGTENSTYSYGICVSEDGGKRALFHNGATLGYQTRLIYLPAPKISIVYLSNGVIDMKAHGQFIKAYLEKHKDTFEAAERAFIKKHPGLEQRFPERMSIHGFVSDLQRKLND